MKDLTILLVILAIILCFPRIVELGIMLVVIAIIYQMFKEG